MNKFEKNLKKVVGIGAITSLSLGSIAEAQSLDGANSSLKQDKKMELEALKPLRTPEDYDISKTARLDLSDLEGKKNLDKKSLEKVATLVALDYEIAGLYGLVYGTDLARSRAKEDEDLEKMFLADKLLQETYEKIKLLNQKKEELKDLESVVEKFEFSEKSAEYLSIIPEIIVEIEEVRQDLIKVISSPDYLTKLQFEFDCSSEEAKRHQAVRLANISVTNYVFIRKDKLDDIFNKENPNDRQLVRSMGIGAYDAKYDNLIYFNYQMGEGDKKDIRGIALHEFLHKVTRRNLGLSPLAIKLLRESFTGNSDVNIVNNYESIPTERYVRLKILELELVEKGIIGVNKKFSREHFNLIYNLYRNGKLGWQATSFINNTIMPTTKEELDSEEFMEKIYQIYKKLFDEIADASSDSQKTYFNPDWAYDGAGDNRI